MRSLGIDSLHSFAFREQHLLLAEGFLPNAEKGEEVLAVAWEPTESRL